MSSLAKTAPAFVEIAHRIVWASVATVAPDGQPWTRILHPIWQWDGATLTGWIATGPTPVKSSHLDHRSAVSVSYWDATHDTCQANCDTTWHTDDETCTRIWDLFKSTPEPLGYDPAMIPVWTAPSDDSFAVLELSPTWLRVFPGTMLMTGQGEVHTWSAP